MEIIDFINDLRKMGAIYYKVWLPIILQFHKEENITIKLNAPTDIPATTYYRIINYGVSVFPKYVKLYSLRKTYSKLFLCKNEVIKSELVSTIQYENPIQQIQKEETIVAEPIIDKPKKERKKSTETSYPNEIYEEIIFFLNQSTGKNYKSQSAMNRKFITQRLNDGYTIDDFKQVITVKSYNWLGNKMEQFLRPETLFSNKFESYLNEGIISNAPNSNLKNAYDQISIANQLLDNQG